jgi:hypothetical protein
MPPKEDANSNPSNLRPRPTRSGQRRDATLEALIVLSRMLGRQAAREWLSAEICPPEDNHDE